jgi:hypothetical protein
MPVFSSNFDTEETRIQIDRNNASYDEVCG